jgi:hypothetical protein
MRRMDHKRELISAPASHARRVAYVLIPIGPHSNSLQKPDAWAACLESPRAYPLARSAKEEENYPGNEHEQPSD